MRLYMGMHQGLMRYAPNADNMRSECMSVQMHYTTSDVCPHTGIYGQLYAAAAGPGIVFTQTLGTEWPLYE